MKTSELPPENLSAAEQGLLLLAVLLPVLWVFWARVVWVPGWASVDEAGHLADLQLWREGWPLPLRMSWGCLHRFLQIGWMQLLGWRIENLHSLALGLYLAECAALFAVARAWFGARAALWTLCVNAFSAVTFTRLGSILWFQILPLEWLLLMAASLRLRGPWAALLWGAAAGLFLLDYEGWLLALPGLGLLFAQRRKAAELSAALLGFALASAWILWLNRDWFHATLLLRQDQSLPRSAASALGYLAAHGGEMLFGGGRNLLYLGVPGHPQVAPWAWVGFLASAPLWRRHWRLLLAALPPLASLALHSPGAEPNRCLAAWPLFCLLSGAGFARLSRGGWPRPLLWLSLLALGGAVWEMQAFAAGLRSDGARFYGQSWNQLEAGRQLRQIGDVTLLSDLGPASGADLRFASGLRPDQLTQGPLVAVIPWQDQPHLDAQLGAWSVIQKDPEEAPLLLLSPKPGFGVKLQAINADLSSLWPLYYGEPQTSFLKALETRCQAPSSDPRLQTPLWEARFKLARTLGQGLPDEARLAQQWGLLRVDPWLRTARAQASEDPRQALAWLALACDKDPRRREAWQLRLALLGQLGQIQERDQLLSRLRQHPDWGGLRPEWLQL